MEFKGANVHPDAKIGANVIIEPFATVGADVVIGDGTWVGPNAVIMDGSRIGANCKIFPGAVIGAVPQDLKYKGENSLAEVGDNTIIRECVTINRGTVDRMTTKVGNNCLLMAYVHVAHDAIIGNGCIIANQASIAGHVTIDDFVIIEGGSVAIQQFVHIGSYSFISGGSLVRKNVPPYIKVAREPLSFVGVNVIGMRRRGIAEEKIRAVEDIYRVLFIHSQNLKKGIEQIKSQGPNPHFEEILTFIEESSNGIIKGYN